MPLHISGAAVIVVVKSVASVSVLLFKRIVISRIPHYVRILFKYKHNNQGRPSILISTPTATLEPWKKVQ